ncbi:Gfo/Idh/MocA family oxidoreductase [Paenibacillus oenotherae]|uniref:Gfo/Idh/MocA family oxidoreductase n=1 Tax=Paenibacillus oenotherae TaxID=1435645 RepID=A0ABS7D7D6_9BACL|nr:Gfo/Idh/MocA family oxidoreductase [Paenibacillus oenotherae]MBW7475751.1 Gfo/Idh/MocA family oxidoreductase [Paenibacillus oenotherae]
MNSKGYAVIGAGYFGARLAEIITTIEGARLVAVLDPDNGAEVAARLGCDVESDLDAICSREDVDAVVVATPNYLHKEPVLIAARYGKQVFCEKPIALSYEDCNAMIEATKSSGVLFVAGHIMNFMNGVRTAKTLINEGKIGELLFCHAERIGWEEPQPTFSWKKLRDKSGGHLYHHIHELDLVQFLMGPAKTACMVGGNVAHNGEGFGDEDDMLLITLEFGADKYATLQYGSAFRWNEHYVKINGTKGAILVDLQDVKVILKTEEGETRYLLHESQEEDDDRTAIYKNFEVDSAIAYGKPGKTPPMWLDSIMKKEMNYLHYLVQGGQADEEFVPLIDGTAARAAIATADALTLSLQENRKVDVSEVTG